MLLNAMQTSEVTVFSKSVFPPTEDKTLFSQNAGKSNAFLFFSSPFSFFNSFLIPSLLVPLVSIPPIYPMLIIVVR